MFPSLQELNELIEQVADDDAQYQHNQMQLQHGAWLLSHPPGYTSDDDIPDTLTQVTAVEPLQLPSIADRAPTNTVVAQTRCDLAAEPIRMQPVVIMTMIVYATWTIMNLVHSYVVEFFE